MTQPSFVAISIVLTSHDLKHHTWSNPESRILNSTRYDVWMRGLELRYVEDKMNGLEVLRKLEYVGVSTSFRDDLERSKVLV